MFDVLSVMVVINQRIYVRNTNKATLYSYVALLF